METISLIVPCYNEHETIEAFYNEATKYMDDLHNWNIIYVNDGSKDNSIEIMKELAKKDPRVKYVGFSRNFGKEAGMYAGLEAAKKLNSDAAIIMDVDLQDPPRLLPEFIEAHNEGYNLIFARQKDRSGQSKLGKIFSLGFYKVYAKLTGDKKMSGGARDYCLLDRKVIDAFLSVKDYERFTKGIYNYVGFKSKIITFDYEKRVAGETKWTFRKLFKYAFVGIREFSDLYLIIPKFIGILVALLLSYDIGYQIYNVINLKDIKFFDWTHIRFDALILGVIIILYYLMKLGYQNRAQVRNRPIYILEESNIGDEESN
jgi:glycosyltransferase involved in cell wall biosynthesis